MAPSLARLCDPEEQCQEALVIKDANHSNNNTALLLSWNAATIHLAEAATIAFLLLQLPQIILNTRNLIAGDYRALFAVQWMGQLTSLLGNLSLLSYFAGKRERGAMAVQTVGMLTTLVVLMQLAMAGAMPTLAFIATTVSVIVGLLLNFLNYIHLLPCGIWRLWKETTSVGGATVLLQVMWSTFEPYVPHSYFPAFVGGVSTLALVTLERVNILPQNLSDFTIALSAWTATLLFMWAPVAQMVISLISPIHASNQSPSCCLFHIYMQWQNFLDPSNIKGLSLFTILFAMIGNGLLLPRALFTRDLMWFTGAAWGTLLQGWGILLTMYIDNSLSAPFFWTMSCSLTIWLGFILFRDSGAYSLNCPLIPLLELFSGNRGLHITTL